MDDKEKQKKAEEDRDYSDEQGGGGVEDERPFTEDDFEAALYKTTRRVEDEDEGEKSPD